MAKTERSEKGIDEHIPRVTNINFRQTLTCINNKEKKFMGIGKLSPRWKYFHFSTNSFKEILDNLYVDIGASKIFSHEKSTVSVLRPSEIPFFCLYPFRKSLSMEAEEGLLAWGYASGSWIIPTLHHVTSRRKFRSDRSASSLFPESSSSLLTYPRISSLQITKYTYGLGTSLQGVVNTQ